MDAPQLTATPTSAAEPAADNDLGRHNKRKLSELEAHDENNVSHPTEVARPLRKGIAPIKAEYLIDPNKENADPRDAQTPRDDRSRDVADQDEKPAKKGKRSKAAGQNTNRRFGHSEDKILLCMSRGNSNEFSPKPCKFGDGCRFEHNLRRYLAEGKRPDLDTFGGECPVYKARGRCNAGWKCRFAASHSREITHEDGRKELVLLQSDDSTTKSTNGHSNNGAGGNEEDDEDDSNPSVVNILTKDTRTQLRKKQIKLDKSDRYTEWLNRIAKASEKGKFQDRQRANSSSEDESTVQDRRAEYIEPPFRPSEKRRLYYGPETPVLAPLTTQGNMPFRRLCVDLGAQVTWSEMAMGMPLLQGERSEWALLKAHESELTPPRFTPQGAPPPFYSHAEDFKFGAQIAGNKPWLALKTTELISRLCPRLRAVDLNCGCPIDLVYRQGAGSALLDVPGKLEKMLRGMNAVSGEIPVTVKIRMGTRDNHPTAERLVERLAFGGVGDSADLALGPAGIAAVTLHGRSRQQRYTRTADWEYIARCAAVVQRYNSRRDQLTDTAAAPDPRDLPAGERLYFVGNGDCYSPQDYAAHISEAKVDSVMAARGALIKPWLFEEIGAGQLLDKSASERLSYIERFCRYGLDTWGADEVGLGTTWRFLLEWLSFACRYVPVGLLEVLPPRIQDRPPAFRGRNELETLMASDNYKDWIRISEMFLGKAAEGFRFEPKHKSNAYEETEAEG